MELGFEGEMGLPLRSTCLGSKYRYLRYGHLLTMNSPPKTISSTEVKALNPVAGGLLNAVEAVASALLGDGSDIASNVQAQASVLTATIIPVGTNIASTVLIGAATQVPTALADATNAINQATGVVGGIVGAANSIVGSVVAGAVSTSNTGILSTSVSQSRGTSPSSTREPQEFLPQTGPCMTCNNSSPLTALPFNITSVPRLSSTSVLPMAPSGGPTCTSCPLPFTETCTVTETWHSTHYAETATYFSFIAAFTVTCTETVRYV